MKSKIFLTGLLLAVISAPLMSEASCEPFKRALSFGGRGEDVRLLQQLLNSDEDTRVASSGPGSSGSETNYFGKGVRAALKKFQAKHSDVFLGVQTGSAGPLTRKELNSLYCKNETPKDTGAEPSTPKTGTVATGTTPASVGVPRITSVTPTIINPGDTITITGENLGNPSTISISSSGVGTSYRYVYPHIVGSSSMVLKSESKTLVLRTPEVKKGEYIITVETQNASSVYLNQHADYKFVVTGDTKSTDSTLGAPTITSISPTVITSGDSVTLTGTNFGDIATANVSFSSNAVGSSYSYTYPHYTGGMVTSANDGRLVLRTPEVRAGDYLVTVKVYNPKYLYGYQSVSKLIAVKDKVITTTQPSTDSTLGAPTITSISPTVITSGDSVTLMGSNFGDIATTNISISSNAVGSTYSYSYPHYTGGMVTSASDSQLVLRTPEVKAGDYLITVEIYNRNYLYGYQRVSKLITVKDKVITTTQPSTDSALGAPTITSISPSSSITSGDTITLSGSNFGDIATTNVSFSSSAVGSTYSSSFQHFVSSSGNVLAASNSSLTLRTPEVKAGDYLITVEIYNQNYLYGYQRVSKLITVKDKVITTTQPSTDSTLGAPTITSISPTVITSGDSVTLMGSNFGDIATTNIGLSSSAVGSSYSYTYPHYTGGMILSASDSQLVLRTPEVKAGDYLISIVIYNPKYLYGYQTVSKLITVKDKVVESTQPSTDATLGAPTITSVSPSSIISGGTVTLMGSNFGDIATTNISISSNAVGSTYSYSYPHYTGGMVTSASDSSLTLRTPEVKAGDYLITVEIYNPKYLYGYQRVSKLITVQ